MRVIIILTFISMISGAPPLPTKNITVDKFPKFRSAGGWTTTIQNHPYIVSILVDQVLVCGGSILTKWFILSAGHCLDEHAINRFSVGVGSERYRQNWRIPIAKIKFHEYYRVNTPTMKYMNEMYDIAVARLGRQIQFGPTVQPVCLYNQDEQVAVGATANIAGWGDTDWSGTTPEVLREVVISINSPWQCPTKSSYGVICAGSPNKGVCSGDSGGPLMVQGRQAGIAGMIMRTETNACPGMYGLYTSVATYRSWIEKAVRQLNGPKRLPTDHCESSNSVGPIPEKPDFGNWRNDWFSNNLWFG